MITKRSLDSWLMPVIVLLGAALRLYNLTYHSLWFDEAISIRWAQSGVSRILEVSMKLVDDRLPPLYYLLLKWWGDVAGLSEFSARFPSVVFGTLLIPVVYALGRRLFGQRTGALAALLTALNPFLIWYSQEARMYSLAVLLGTFGVLCFVMAVFERGSGGAGERGSGGVGEWRRGGAGEQGSRGVSLREGTLTPSPPHSSTPLLLLSFGAAALAGLYTHLYTGFLWPALAIWLLFNPKILKRVWLPFGATMGTVSLLFLPLALANWRFSGESTPGDPLAGVWERVSGLFRAFSVWRAPLPAKWETGVLLVLAFFLLAGLITALKSRKGRLVILLLTTPFLIASVLMLRSELAFFGPRYFIVMLPWVLLLQASGALKVGEWVSKGVWEWGSRGVGEWGSGAETQSSKLETRNLKLKTTPLFTLHSSLFTVVLLVATIIPIPGQWSVAAAKEAWRQTTAYMTTHVTPADAVFIHPEWIRFPYQYYAAQMKTPGQTYAAFFAVDENTDLDGRLGGVIAAGHPVVWLIESHLDTPDPQRRVENWFAARYPLVTELYPPGVTLKAYAPGYQLKALPSQAAPIEAAPFASGLKLLGVEVQDTRLPPTDALFHPPSNWIHVALYWTRDAEGAQDVFPYVHLIDEQGQVWGASLERGNDALHFYPPSRWEAGQIIRQDVDVNLNPLAPPGDYRLIVGIGDETIDLSAVELTGF